MEANFLTDIFLPILVIVIMFGLGLNLTIDDFKRVAVYPKAAIIGLFNQLVILPLAGFLLASLFSLSPELAVGIMIVAAAPGGAASNVITHLLEADTALSVTLTALSSLVAFITIPLWVGLALSQFINRAEAVSVPVVQLSLQVALVTLIPVGLGLFVRSRWPGFFENTKSLVKIGSGVLIIVAIVVFLIDQREDLSHFLVQAGIAAAILCLSTTLLGYGTANLFKLRPATRITIAVETGIQNVPLSLTIAAGILGNPRFAISPAAYGLIMVMLMAVILVGVIARWPILRVAAE